MNFEDFRRILRSFGTAPESVDTDKGTFVLQIGEDVVSGKVQQRQGDLFLTEHGTTAALRANEWIVRRLASIPTLAEAIYQYTPAVPNFVVPRGSLLDSLDQAPAESPEERPDAAATLTEMLDRRPAGATSLVYLTSDAGEGKTTVIAHLARQQADRYRSGTADWLIVPIALGGRPFLRLDEVVTAALVNHFRFRSLFWDSFLELVRMGVLVPALDGFEELFFEDAEGEAISSLCSLLEKLGGSGTLLIAARKAYFEFRRIEAASAIVDRMKSGSVAASRVSLLRWRRDQFLQYAALRAKSNGETVFSTVASQLGEEHPVLARPVLASRLLDLADQNVDLGQLVRALKQNPGEYFSTLVESILEREATLKWLDRTGDPAVPLLSLDEHRDLLAFVAGEMWLGGSESLGLDVLEVAADLFSDAHKKSASVARQVRERIRQHALLVKSRTSPNRIEFDHQEFFHHFLGRSLAMALAGQTSASVRSILRRGSLPSMSVESAISCLKEMNFDRKSALERLDSASTHEGARSYSEENLGALVLQTITPESETAVTVERATFPVDALMDRSLKRVVFRGCVFRSTSLEGFRAADVQFLDCDFEKIDLDDDETIEGAEMRDCRVAALGIGELVLRDPRRIDATLGKVGLVRHETPVAVAQESSVVLDADLKLTLRALRAFIRLTEVNEYTWRSRLGKGANHFLDDLLPKLIEHGSVREVEYHGKGTQRRFRLALPLTKLLECASASDGTWADFFSRI